MEISLEGYEEKGTQEKVIACEKKMLFIYNPHAGTASIRSNLLDIIDVFTKAGYLVTAYPTQMPGDAVTAAVERSGDYDIVACSGGDGTLDEVVTGMMKRTDRRPIGYVPAGSTNDFAKSLHISSNMMKAADTIVGGKIFSCDMGSFNDDTFVYIAAFGLFTEVSYETDQQIKNVLGHMAYILEGAKSLGNARSYHMRVTYQDEKQKQYTIEEDFLFGMITNSTSVGGFRKITGKHVHLDDGLFEVTLIRQPRDLIELNNIMIALMARKIDNNNMYCFKTDRLLVESEEEIAWTLDGEFGGNHTEVVIKNRKQALDIIVPA
jgi:YegS/Rv2252/BmrU family lipid kinase